ncbi:hypothetical protein ACQ4PT_035387 [Festuca glaucescens]
MAGGLPAVMARAVPVPAAIPAGAMAAAEVAAAEVVRRVHPTDASERRRAEVVEYARRIVGTALGCEVFVFGSVPLKTYLPDGDIDLTVIGNTSRNSTFIDDIYYILGSGEQNTDAEFEVKDLEHIDAEVLYRFLEYFSKFDWDNYCISLNGPVAVSSLPNLIVEGTNVPGDDLLFDKEFLEESVEKAFVQPRNFDARCTKFRVKHLNIIDPLKECNNLGRSVNRGDLESQLRCLRQVQYNLEYLFDELLQPVKEASSDGNVDQDLFDILNRSILLSTDMTLPGLMLPSYTETDGRKLSPVSSHSTEVSQQSQDEDHWGAVFDLNACGIDVPSNGLSPSYFADSDISVSWCPTLEAVPTMHGTGLYTREKVGSRNSRF